MSTSASRNLGALDVLGAPRLFGALFTILGLVGFGFSFQIMRDVQAMNSQPGFVPACSVNAIVSCGDVMASSQASAFGFANHLIGLGGFALVAALGVALLFGVRLPRWMWWCMVAGFVLATVFVHWMAYEAIFVIGALCLYCLGVWIVTLALVVMTVFRVLRPTNSWSASMIVQPALILFAWYVGFAVLIVQELFR